MKRRGRPLPRLFVLSPGKRRSSSLRLTASAYTSSAARNAASSAYYARLDVFVRESRALPRTAPDDAAPRVHACRVVLQRTAFRVAVHVVRDAQAEVLHVGRVRPEAPLPASAPPRWIHRRRHRRCRSSLQVTSRLLGHALHLACSRRRPWAPGPGRPVCPVCVQASPALRLRGPAIAISISRRPCPATPGLGGSHAMSACISRRRASLPPDRAASKPPPACCLAPPGGTPRRVRRLVAPTPALATCPHARPTLGPARGIHLYGSAR